MQYPNEERNIYMNLYDWYSDTVDSRLASQTNFPIKPNIFRSILFPLPSVTVYYLYLHTVTRFVLPQINECSKHYFHTSEAKNATFSNVFSTFHCISISRWSDLMHKNKSTCQNVHITFYYFLTRSLAFSLSLLAHIHTYACSLVMTL